MLTLFFCGLIVFARDDSQPAKNPRLIPITITGKVKPTIVKSNETIPLEITIANDLPGPIVYSTFSLKPNDWNGETISVSLVDICRGDNPRTLFLQKPKVVQPRQISGVGGHRIKTGEKLLVTTDARKWVIADGWIPGKYKVTVKANLQVDDGRCHLTIMSEPFEFEIIN
jgi:hypothetical protein